MIGLKILFLSLSVYQLLVHQVHSARILGVFFVPSVSHQVVFQPVVKELSLKGHEVVVVTPNPLKDPSLTNLTEIDVSFLYKHSHTIEDQFISVSRTQMMKAFFKFHDVTMEGVLDNIEVRRIYENPNEHFDLILIELFSPTLHAFGERFNAPVIGMVSLDGLYNMHSSVGNPSHPVLLPDPNSNYGDLTIFEKIENVYYFVWYYIYYNFKQTPRADAIANKYFGGNLSYMGDLEKNVSMVFINTNPLLSPIRPNVPCVVPMGFMHVKPLKPLPLDMKQILDDAKEGAVYFSLGSNVKSANLNKNLKKVIIETLSELPYTVLWKWESDHVPGVGKNVITRKWFPQQDILAHPNIKVFVTQGGLQSSEEAISRGVPLVGMPFLGDQPMNVKKLVKLGMALEVNPFAVTKEQLKQAILTVAQNPKYKERVLELRDIVNDQPMTGLERAVWWSEYVIRHKGAAHLRSPLADVSFYEYFLLDVIGVVLGAALLVLFVVYKIVRVIIGFFRPKNKLKSS